MFPMRIPFFPHSEDGPGPGNDRSEVPYASLEDLAAGDLPPEAAAALERRIDAEPALRRAYEEACRLEALLRSAPLEEAPPGLTQRVLLQVMHASAPRTAPARPLATLLRVAALVLVFFSSWLIVGGDAPAFADMRKPGSLVASLPGVDGPEVIPSGGTWADVPLVLQPGRAPKGGKVTMKEDPIVVGALGVLLIAAGVFIAARNPRRLRIAGKEIE